MRVPLVVVTGFLGSGKTTLINRLLARRAAGNATDKLGVIVNELGAIDIDGALLGGDTQRQITLPGGCVCCVMGDELDKTLLELVETNTLSAIVLETTGVAEPLPIAWAASRPPVSDRVRLAAVVTLVDATVFRSSRSVSGAVDAQVAYADVLLLTKSELAGAAEVSAVTEAVRTLAPRALVRAGTTDEHAAWLEDVLVDPPVHERAGGAPHVHDEHCDHTHGIASAAIELAGEVDLEELEDQLGELPASVVRIKGIVRGIDGRDGRQAAGWYAVHRVGLRVSSEPVPDPGFQQGRLVALGTAVDPAMLASCVARATF